MPVKAHSWTNSVTVPNQLLWPHPPLSNHLRWVIAKREAAIVSDIPGTTRDVLEVNLDLGGYPVIMSDTAGLRESNDPIEMEGVKRAISR